VKSVNLIPVHRRIRNRRSRRIRAWLVAGAIYLPTIIFGGLIARWSLRNTPAPLADRLQRVSDEVEKVKKATSAVHGEHRLVAEQLRFHAEIADTVDHTALLSAIADQLGEESVLGAVRVIPITTSPLQPARPSNGRAGVLLPAQMYRVELRGHARSQPAVSQLLLSLQNMKLFSDVKLVRTGREPYLNFESVAFQIDCQLSD
jgi:Tfp pilus assembly protein PilN